MPCLSNGLPGALACPSFGATDENRPAGVIPTKFPTGIFPGLRLCGPRSRSDPRPLRSAAGRRSGEVSPEPLSVRSRHQQGHAVACCRSVRGLRIGIRDPLSLTGQSESARGPPVGPASRDFDSANPSSPTQDSGNPTRPHNNQGVLHVYHSRP